MSDKTYTEEELANLSDDELMGMAITPTLAPQEEDSPAGDEAAQAAAGREEGGDGTEGDQGQDDGDDDKSDEDFEKDPKPSGKGDDDDPDAGDGDPEGEEGASAVPGSDKKAKPGAEDDKAQKDPKDGEKDPAGKGAEGTQEVDYKAVYEQIMAPFKANGKEIKLKSPEEAVQLMQMGANYTKKLQALQPNLRLLKMLENNNLLDEGKISFLIDLEQKNPQAIQKLLKESGVDPLDIDTSTEPNYKPGNHKVSDAEMAFNSTLEEVVTSIPAGKETIIAINKTWDEASKEAIWADPSIIRLMAEQKQNGVYDRVSEEIERRKMLGKLGPHVPFLQAYRDVGTEMTQQGAFNDIHQPAKGGDSNPADPSRVVDTRVAARKPTVSNSDRAKAASSTRSKPAGGAKEDFNPLALSDEDFEKTERLARRL